MSSSKRTLFAVGKLVKAFGIKGELVLQPMTDSKQRLKRLKQVFVGRDDGSAQERTVEHVHVGDRGVRMKLAEIDHRSAAQTLVGLHVFVDETARVRLPKGRYFIHDVIGLKVIDQHQQDVGTVTDILRMPAHDVYVITSGRREVMVPAVQEFIKNIDIETRTMRVRLIEGMVE